MPLEMVTVTPQMARHMDYVSSGRRGDLEDRDEFKEDFVEKANKYLDNPDYEFDDSEVYGQLDEEYTADFYKEESSDYAPQCVDDRPARKPARQAKKAPRPAPAPVERKKKKVDIARIKNLLKKERNASKGKSEREPAWS